MYENKYSRAVFRISSDPIYSKYGKFPMYELSTYYGKKLNRKFYEAEILLIDPVKFVYKFKFPFLK